MPINQVEYLPVSARERIECRPDPAVRDVSACGRKLAWRTIGKVLISSVEESQRFGEISDCSSRLRRAAHCGPRPIAVEAFPAAEREQPGPHPARVLQTPGQGVTGDQGQLGRACGTGTVAEKTETKVEEVLGMLVEHLGERVPIAGFWPRIRWAQRRHPLSLTCHRMPPLRPRLFRCRPSCCRLSRCRPNIIQFKQGVLDGTECNIPSPVFAMRPAGG
jgi:hypothetical protein